MKAIFLLIVLFGFNAMAADVFPGFESAKPTTDSVPAETKSEKFGSEPKVNLEVNRRLDEQRARAVEQRTFDNLKHPRK